MMRSMTNDEMTQHLVDRINELEKENKELIQDDILASPTYHKAVETFGKEHTMLAAVSKMNELEQEITKVLRNKADFTAIDNRIADVEIFVEMLKYVFHNKNEVKRWKRKKILKLRERIEKGE